MRDQSIKTQGPASLKDMRIVYPCTHLCCSVRCPCSVCNDERDNCKTDCKDKSCRKCNAQCNKHQIKLPRVFDAEHDHCMIVTQKIDEVQIGVTFSGIPLSCPTCSNDIEDHQAPQDVNLPVSNETIVQCSQQRSYEWC